MTDDEKFIRRALRLTLRGRGRTSPNPCVGAVAVLNGEIVGEGWTQTKPGVGIHAEGEAIRKAGEKARGATLYVTMEPCSHTRRPDGTERIPCTQRIIEAGVARVVCCCVDPNPLVNGNGIRILQEAGIQVEVGFMAEQAEETHAAFFKHQRTGLPLITHKAALSLDGKISSTRHAPTGISGSEARTAVHRLRDQVDAIVVGVGTILADNPMLTTRLPGGKNGRNPVVVIFDTNLRTPPDANVVRPGTIWVTTRSNKESDRDTITVSPDAQGRPDVTAALKALAERGLINVLLESGGALAASFWEAKMVDRALFFVAPIILGGVDAPTPIDGTGLSKSVRLTKMRVRRYGEDTAIFGIVNWEGQ
ncbi:MAG: bifunctional diaminohydroxyphosphoribosylaminopyrimidine deaminase/5-amino-6-(5-phosphoribosylamino)uracil reductase RibD [Armatimonas sp.]